MAVAHPEFTDRIVTGNLHERTFSVVTNAVDG
jgi:hypothetical protein